MHADSQIMPDWCNLIMQVLNQKRFQRFICEENIYESNRTIAVE